ncbi:FYVE, RhoGEF and PH domain-containing protein 5-like isoform X2 [Cololabis saira]|uniref:FYVE, RhoGEF and PH domain-containing protein 5-like isoform X2 n=1 Tax=Cololabis saira TaxID=129043 RepID=UPI002AD465EE|nr:FYVE, RhoGEF and PH domain-containing protein 5-like isoform X2 [Cololabis saira]
MNTDCNKPSISPKPRAVCHASLRLPSPLTSAARGPKPYVAPKPKVTVRLNGNRGGFCNGNIFTSDHEANEDHETRNGRNKVIMDTSHSEKQLKLKILKSPPTHLYHLSNREEREEEKDKEEEENVIQKMDEDWRLPDSALTKEVDSLETLWVGDARLPCNSEEGEKMIDTEVAENMDAEGCDAGEALADTDGLSVGDFSVNSTDEEGRCYSADSQDSKQEKLQINKDGNTAEDLSWSLTDEPGHLVKENMMHAGAKHNILKEKEEKEEESGRDCGFTCNILKLRCGHKVKEKGENRQDICFYDSVPEKQKACDTMRRRAALESDRAHEPFYISSEDIINTELGPESTLTETNISSTNKSVDLDEETAENGQIDYHLGDEYCSDHSYQNKVGTCEKEPSVQAEEAKLNLLEDVLNHLGCQSMFRQVSASVPTDMDRSLTSSLSGSQLLSPNNSDVFRDQDDLEGYIVPFLDETTDAEQDNSDEHLYEEPGRVSKGENLFSLDSKATGIRTYSLSHRVANNVEDMGGQFFQKSCKSGIGQPALSSSPMLSSTRHRSLSKPHYLSLYPRSISMEGQDRPLCVYREQRDALCPSESFSRCSPLSSSTVSTPTSLVDIPPPFELAYITKKPIMKSSPSLLIGSDLKEKNRKKKSSIKRFFMLKFGRKTENKPVVDVKPSSFKSSAESSHHSPSRLLDLERHSISGSPRLNQHLSSNRQVSPETASTFLFYKESKRKGNSVAFLNRSVIRVESFEDRSRVPFIPIPLTKPRSISFPNTDTSDYENIPAISSDYENVQVPQWRTARQVPLADFFDRPSRVMSSVHETDGYVDMSSLPGFEKKTQSSEQESESAYTEAYVCPMAVSPQTGSVGNGRGETLGDEDQGRTSEEEDGTVDNYDRQPDGRSRAFYIVKELVDTERLHVTALKLLQEDFREAVGSAVGDQGQPVLVDERLREILNELPDVYNLHCKILTELENRIRHWEDNPRIADIFLSRRAEFVVFTTYIGHYDRSMSLLEDSCQTSPAFAAIAQTFEEKAAGKVSLKQQLLQVIVRVAQYRMLLTDYLNNLSPDSKEYEDTQAAVSVMSDIADQVNDSLKHGENLLRLINIAYSVHGQRDLLHPGRVFVKEGTLMKVSRKSRQPRHLFLMNDVLLYTYPQQNGKYRLKNTLPLTDLKVTKPFIENVQNALKIEGADISITLSASSFLEREDWFYTLNRAVTENTRGSGAFNNCSREPRDRLRLFLGEKAPTLVPVSQVMMCMNCTSDFSLTLRRHHCQGCGRIVCRSCSRNRYPLKYMKDRMAKVCDHCYNELKKRGGDVTSLSGKGSPQVSRSSRPLSAMFQNIHPPNIWRHRKGTVTFTRVTVSEEGSISGSLQRSKKTKRNWKRLWFLLKDKVLYTYRAQEEKVASESLPLLGFTVKLPDRWVNAMEEATNL